MKITLMQYALRLNIVLVVVFPILYDIFHFNRG